MPPLKRSPRPIRLFCSYSHKDEALRKKLEDHLSLLKRQGFISYWHDRRIAAGTEWAGEIDDNLEAAEVILLLISTNFLASDYCYDKEMTRAMERHKAGAARVIPVILRQCDWHTASFGKLQALPKDGKAVELWKNHDAGFTNVANGIRMIVEHRGAVSHDRSDLSQPVTVTSTPQVVFLRLSTLSNENKFTARTKDLTTLTEAWDDNDVNVLILVAQGGVGKTALVKKWLMTEMAPGPNKYGGAEVVLARSFDEERITEDIFLGEALRECGDPKPNWGSPEDRGRRLAGLLRSRRSLLILDGLERIQQPQGANKGNVGPGMAALLTDLAAVNHGLCVVTTRQSIRQLEGWLNGTAREVRLEHLSPDDAIALLDRLGIKGPEAEKREVAIYLRGHCLALELMATYLIDRHDGQVNHWSDDDFTADPEKTDSVRRMLKRYEGWLKPPEREMLRVVSAFDESIGDEEFDVLRRKPVLEGLNTVIAKLGLQSLTEVHHRLTELGLLSGDRVKGHIKYECHPLIRRYFARLFAKQYPDSFKAANLRLFEYYSARPESPDMKLSELQSLLNAVRFGCRAGRHAEAWHNVFWPRIRRNRDGETRNYSLRVLGAFSSDLSALREFFDERWVGVRPGFEPQTEALILMEAGSVLRGLARFKDAQDALQASHEFARDHENASGASEAAGNLAELYVRTGELLKAVEWGQVALQFADASEDTFLKIVIRGVLANALHATGELDRALAIFSESEALQRDREPDRPILYGIQGWEYWDCLISFRNYREVIQKAQATRSWLTETWKLRNGLTDLAIGLAQLGLVEADGSQALVEAAEHLKRAHRLLTDSQRQEYSPRGILAIARLARAEGNSQEAIDYLMEVLPQVEAKGMKPNLVDTHLELARNYKDLGRESEYLSSLKSAETLIEETGYHVRDPEVAALTRN